MSGNISLSWEHVEHLSHKVRNIVRRGYLKKTYYDKDLMQARIKTGHGIENDRIDIMHPVGYLGRVQADDKAEVFTMDVGGDSSRRVVLGVMGDRKSHPKVLEGESILYSPGDPQNFLRVFKKPPKKQNGGGQQAAEGEEEGGSEQSPDSREAIYGKYGDTYALFDGKKAQTYYKDDSISTHADENHVHIRFKGSRIFVDGACWATMPINIKQDPDAGGASASLRADGNDPALPYVWDGASNTYFYNTKMVLTNSLTMTGDFITLHADPVQPMHAVTKRYVDGDLQSGLGGKVAKAGDTMTGYLTLHAAPINAFHAATKGYVDSQGAANASQITTAYQAADAAVTAAAYAADSALAMDMQTKINALDARIYALEHPI